MSAPDIHTSPTIATPPAISPLTAEFTDAATERSFLAAHLGDTRRHVGMLLLVYALVDALFLVTDFRFLGQSHLYVAMVARTAILAASALAAWSILRRTGDGAAVARRLVVWQWLNALAVAALVTPGDDVALALTFLMPVVHLLCVPLPVRMAAVHGPATSAVILAGYLWPGPGPGPWSWSGETPGLIAVMVMVNAMTSLVVLRQNTLARRGWAAMESERAAHRESATNRALLERTFTAVPIPLIICHAADGRIIRHNEATATFFGGDLAAHGIGSTIQLYEDPAQRVAMLDEMAAQGHIAGYEARMRAVNGAERHVLVSSASVEVDGASLLVSGFMDITMRKTLESHLAFLAGSDPLTGMANRHRFFSIARMEMVRARENGHETAVLVIDVDHFKRINDTHGHEAGDAVLQTFADTCVATVRDGDLVARMGGEEFAVLLPDTDMTAALIQAERLRLAAREMVVAVADTELTLTVSIGVACTAPREGSVGPALSRADKAMYRAKHDGRDRVVSDQEHEGSEGRG